LDETTSNAGRPGSSSGEISIAVDCADYVRTKSAQEGHKDRKDRGVQILAFATFVIFSCETQFYLLAFFQKHLTQGKPASVGPLAPSSSSSVRGVSESARFLPGYLRNSPCVLFVKSDF